MNNEYENMATISKSEIWDGIGNFVAINGSDWSQSDPELANEYRTAQYELFFQFQRRAALREKQRSKKKTFSYPTSQSNRKLK